MFQLAILVAALLGMAFPAFGEECAVRFDFGRRDVPDGWNAVTASGATGLVAEDALDANGRPTALRLRQLDGWAGYNTKGYRGEGPFPAAAMGDSFYLDAEKDDSAVLRLEGLQPGGAYRLTLFASRVGEPRRRTGAYSVGGEIRELDASDNERRTLVFERATADERGTLELSVRCAEDQEFAYLGVLEVRGEIGDAVEVLEPPDPLDGPPLVTAKAWAIADGGTGRLLWGHEADTPRQMASTTKIMTALLVLELAAKDDTVLQETVTISERADETGGSSAKVRAGETVSAADLLYGLLLPSGNDAAVALAEHFGDRFAPAGGNGSAPLSGDERLQSFVDAMNARAAELGMEETRYRDPHGNSRNRSSARDLAKLAWHAMQLEAFREYVGTRRHACTLTGPKGEERRAVWKNTNRLLRIEGFDGVKTGTTGGAGACLVSSGHRGDDHLLVVVLGSASNAGRYVDSRNLYRWAWGQRSER